MKNKNRMKINNYKMYIICSIYKSVIIISICIVIYNKQSSIKYQIQK